MSAVATGVKAVTNSSQRVNCRWDCESNVGGCTEVYGHHDVPEHNLVWPLPDHSCSSFPLANPRPQRFGRHELHGHTGSTQCFYWQTAEETTGALWCLCIYFTVTVLLFLESFEWSFKCIFGVAHSIVFNVLYS